MARVYERDETAVAPSLTPYKKCCKKLMAQIGSLQRNYGNGIISLAFENVFKGGLNERCIDDYESLPAAEMTVSCMVKALKKEYDMKTIQKAYASVSKRMLESGRGENKLKRVNEMGRLSDMHKASDVSSVANSAEAKAKSSARRVAQYLYGVCEEFCNEVNEDSKIKIHPYLIQDMNNYLVKKNIHWCVGFTDDDSTPIKQLGMTSFNAGWGIQDPTGPQYSVGEASFFEFENYEPIARPGMGGWDIVLSEKLDDDPMSITSEDLWACLEKDTVFMNWLMTEEYDPDFDEETGEYMESVSKKAAKVKKALKEGFNEEGEGGTCNLCGKPVAGGDFYADDLDSTREIIVEFILKEFGSRNTYMAEYEAQRFMGMDDDEWEESLDEIYNYLPAGSDYLCHDCMYAACEKAVHQWHLDYFDSEVEDEEMFGPMGESKNKPKNKKVIKESAGYGDYTVVFKDERGVILGDTIDETDEAIVNYILDYVGRIDPTQVGYGSDSISFSGLNEAQMEDVVHLLLSGEEITSVDTTKGKVIVYRGR